MMKLLKNIKLNKSGASAAEYALIVAIMGGIIVVAVATFGRSVEGALDTIGGEMTTAAGGGGGAPVGGGGGS
jgi:pilus assembly protein Flp/PilA